MHNAQKSLNSETGSLEKSDLRGFAAQYRDAYPRLWTIAAGMIGDRAFAEDIVQEAAIIAIQKWDQFVDGTNFVAWMSQIVRNCAQNYLRKIHKRKTNPADPLLIDSRPASDAVQEAFPISTDQAPLSHDQVEFDDQVLRALNSLGGEARCCLLLRIVHHLSYSEICDLLQIPQGTAMSHVHRSKIILRQFLETPEIKNPKP